MNAVQPAWNASGAVLREPAEALQIRTAQRSSVSRHGFGSRPNFSITAVFVTRLPVP